MDTAVSCKAFADANPAGKESNAVSPKRSARFLIATETAVVRTEVNASANPVSPEQPVKKVSFQTSTPFYAVAFRALGDMCMAFPRLPMEFSDFKGSDLDASKSC